MKARIETNQWRKVEEIFHHVLELPSELRGTKLSELAGNDSVVMQEVDSLLRAADAAPEFLEAESEIATQYSVLIRRWNQHVSHSTEKPLNSESEHSTDQAFPDSDEGSLTLERMSLDELRSYFASIRPDWDIREQIGTGAAGIVLRVTDKRLQRDVAVKVFYQRWLQRAGREALLRETQAASLANDHIVRLYEVAGYSGPLSYIVMEWIKGPSLREFLNSDTAVTYRETARLIREVAIGLTAAHAAGIIHGDIKPANILLEPIKALRPEHRFETEGATVRSLATDTVNSNDYRAKLTDFGLSRRSIENETDSIESNCVDNLAVAEVGRVAGTPAYASPEQMLVGKSSTLSTDIYGVGATLYHMLCGKPPFTGRPHIIVRQMQAGDLQAPRAVDPKIPHDLESICLKAMALNSANRYATASELGEDLQRFLDGKPVVARPVSRFTALVKLIRREPFLATMFGGIILSLVAGLCLSQYFRWQAVRDAEIASKERDRAQAVTELFKALIRSSDADAGDPNIKMVEALSMLEGKLVSTLANDPVVEADLRSILGTMFFSVAAYEESVRQLERAISLRGDDDRSEAQLKDRIEMANAVRWLYQAERSLRLAEAAYVDAEEIFGSQADLTLHALEVLAGCHQDRGEYGKARELFEQVISRSQSQERTIQARSGLASLLIDIREYAAAERELNWLQNTISKDRNFSKKETLIVQSNLGTALIEQGKVADAITIQESCALEAKSSLGMGHDLTITAFLNYADSVHRSGDSERGASIYSDLMESCRKELGAAHPKTVDATEGLILMWIRMQRYDEALQLADKSLTEIEMLLPPKDNAKYRLQAAKASALSRLGRTEEAANLYEQIVDHFVAQLGEDHTTVVVHKNNYALVLIDASRANEAVLIYDELLSRFKDIDESAMVRVLRRNFGLALLRNGDHELAKQVLLETRDTSLKIGELDNAEKCNAYLMEMDVNAGSDLF